MRRGDRFDTLALVLGLVALVVIAAVALSRNRGSLFSGSQPQLPQKYDVSYNQDGTVRTITTLPLGPGE